VLCRRASARGDDPMYQFSLLHVRSNSRDKRCFTILHAADVSCGFCYRVDSTVAVKVVCTEVFHSINIDECSRPVYDLLIASSGRSSVMTLELGCVGSSFESTGTLYSRSRWLFLTTHRVPSVLGSATCLNLPRDYAVRRAQ
jgi:hypothetical protein